MGIYQLCVFAKALAENQSKNVIRFSTEIGKHFHNFNEDLPAYKANRSSGVATISINPNKKSTVAATISINPARHTSRPKASGEEDRNSNSS